MKNILVTDAQFRASLAVIRSLGKRDIKITAGSEIKNAMGFFSKNTSEKLLYPNPRTNPNEFLKCIYNLVKENKYDYILPIHTYTVFLLIKYKDIFSKYVKIPPPEFDVFYNAYNKKNLIQFAIENGFNCPKTYFIENIDELTKNIKQYPVVVKPSKRHGVGIRISHSESDFRKNYIEMNEKYGQCIVQEYIPNGGEFGVYTIFDYNSEPIALTVKKRIRTHHSYGGVSTLRETVKNEELVNIAFNLLKKINWSGPAMVEFRFDKRDSLAKIMEINPRFWGSLQLSINSGVDFPYLLHNLMLNGGASKNLNYKEGIKCRWLLADIAGFLKKSNKNEIIKDIFKKNIHNDIASLSDPIPGIIAFFFPLYNSCDEEPRKQDPEINLNSFID